MVDGYRIQRSKRARMRRSSHSTRNFLEALLPFGSSPEPPSSARSTCSDDVSCARMGKAACKGRSIPTDKLDQLVTSHIADQFLIFLPASGLEIHTKTHAGFGSSMQHTGSTENNFA